MDAQNGSVHTNGNGVSQSCWGGALASLNGAGGWLLEETKIGLAPYERVVTDTLHMLADSAEYVANADIWMWVPPDAEGAKLFEGGANSLRFLATGLEGLSDTATLRLPASMADELPAYQKAIDDGLLAKTRSSALQRSNARAIWEEANGPVPDGFDVDHIIQRQFGVLMNYQTFSSNLLG